MNHLVFLHAPVVEQLLRGQKRVESRLTRARSHPCATTQPGDRLYCKVVGGDILATAIVERVNVFRDLTPAQVQALAHQYAIPMGCAAEDVYWQDKRHSRTAWFFWLHTIVRCHIPQHQVPRAIRAAWVCNWTPPSNTDTPVIVPEVRPAPGKIAGHLFEQLSLIED